jgi:hypothetical protein
MYCIFHVAIANNAPYASYIDNNQSPVTLQLSMYSITIVHVLHLSM